MTSRCAILSHLHGSVVIDTPRALIAHGKREKGLENLCKLRGLDSEHPYVSQEFMEVCAQVDHEQELVKGKFQVLSSNVGGILKNTSNTT